MLMEVGIKEWHQKNGIKGMASKKWYQRNGFKGLGSKDYRVDGGW